MNKISQLLMVLALSLAVSAYASEEQEFLKLKNTTINLIEALVAEGILSRDRADQLIREAESKAQQEVTQREVKQAQPKGNVVRVPYVPQFVRDEIRQQVKSELREDVVGDVMKQAETERWGVPGTMPEWTSRIKLKGDIRLRGQADMYSTDNFVGTHVDYLETNENRQLTVLNSTEDRNRARLRLRLGVDATVTNNLKAGIRLVTGDSSDPVSTNQTMGQDFDSYEVSMDRAYLKYEDYDEDSYNYLTLMGGRTSNPFFSTDLLWDSDLNFEGFSATYRMNLSGGDDLFALEDETKTLFLTLGAYALDEVHLSLDGSDDKWLYAFQLGTEWIMENQSSFKIALSYYDYQNITGEINEQGDRLKDYTAPGFMQKGNSMFDISSDVVSGSIVPFRQFGLASDYDIANLTFEYDVARFAPLHVVLTADFVKNVGYDNDEILERLQGRTLFVDGSRFAGDASDDQTEGYHVNLMLGWPDLTLRGNWQVSFGYKYLERDAVLDAYTDSDFHLGGTNAKGWIVSGSYGINENTWLSARYLSADEIEGPPLAIDVMQLDLNAKF